MIKIKGFYALFFSAIIIIMVISPLPLLNLNSNIAANTENDNYFLIKDEQAGKIEKVSTTDYVIGVIAGEMSPESPMEALKAQAVAAYTYALYKRNLRIQNGYEYDLTSNHTSDQEYLSKTQQVALWKDDYSKNRSILESVVDQVNGIAITFGSKPILAVYHSVSSGKTEAAANIWSGNYPYLQSVQSSADLLSPEYKSEVKYSAFDFADRALDLGVTLVGAPNTWLGESIRDEGGYVTKYMLLGHEISGANMRSAFSLSSTDFDLEYKEEEFVFTVRGKGHGVGMSQYGAKVLAEQGSSYQEILSHYYPGTIIQKIDLDN